MDTQRKLREGSRQFARGIHWPEVQGNCRDASSAKERRPQHDRGGRRLRPYLNAFQEVPRGRGQAARLPVSEQVLFQALEVTGQVDVSTGLQD